MRNPVHVDGEVVLMNIIGRPHDLRAWYDHWTRCLATIHDRKDVCAPLRMWTFSLRIELKSYWLLWIQLEPIRLLHILHLPIKLIRFATDPIVDLCFFIISYLTLPLVALFKSFRNLSFSAAEVNITETTTQASQTSYNINVCANFIYSWHNWQTLFASWSLLLAYFPASTRLHRKTRL